MLFDIESIIYKFEFLGIVFLKMFALKVFNDILVNIISGPLKTALTTAVI